MGYFFLDRRNANSLPLLVSKYEQLIYYIQHAWITITEYYDHDLLDLDIFSNKIKSHNIKQELSFIKIEEFELIV